MNNPLITILMPTYNSAAFISKAINSVFASTYKNFELLIVDDGSNDNSYHIIKNYRDSRIIYLRKEHSGIAESLNYGITKSSGEWIARLDADDIMYSKRLEKQLRVVEVNPEVKLVGSGHLKDN